MLRPGGLTLKQECDARARREAADSKIKSLRQLVTISSSSSSERSTSRGSRRNRKRSRDSRKSRSRSSRKKSRSKVRRSSSSRSSSSSDSSGSRRRSRKKSRSVHRGRSHRSSSRSSACRENLTSSTNPKHLARRVFVGNLPTDNMFRGDVEAIFKKYGNILCTTLKKGFAFVQFQHKDDALKAVKNERGCTYNAYRLDIKMALEGRDKKQLPNETTLERLPPPSFFHGLGGPRLPMPPFMDGYRLPLPHPYYNGPPRYPMDYPPMYGRGLLDEFGRPPRLDVVDPSRRLSGPPDASLDRRGPYGDTSQRSRSPSLPVHPIRTTDCEIIVLNEKQRAYADGVVKALKTGGLVIELNFLPATVEVGKAIETAARRKLAFVVIVGEENEQHHSMTVNILHGQPEEHRNMPLEDAIALVVRSFEQYRQTLPPEKKTEFIPPDKNTLYLLNLLADNRYLTVEELREVMEYLEDRSDRLIEAQGGVPPKKKLQLQAKMKEELLLAKQESLLSQKPLQPATAGARQQVMNASPKQLSTVNTSPVQYLQTSSSYQPQGANVHAGLREPAQRGGEMAAQYISDVNTSQTPRSQQQQQQPLPSYSQPGNSNMPGSLRHESPLSTDVSRYSEFNAGPRPRLETTSMANAPRVAGPPPIATLSAPRYPVPNAPTATRPPLGATLTMPGSNMSIANMLNNKSINFDNPMVQNALDNLISSGSSLFKNISGMQFQANKPSGGVSGGAGVGTGGGLDPGKPTQDAGSKLAAVSTLGAANAGVGREKGTSYDAWDKFVSNVREHPEKY